MPDFPKKSFEVSVGDLIIGGGRPPSVQSMTNTDTNNIKATVHQCMELYRAGCQMIRITAPGIKEAENLAVIKKELRKNGVRIPLVADIHFQPKVAETAARIVEKIRINPGNFVDKRKSKTVFSSAEYELEPEKIAQNLKPLIEICRQYGTAVRIGTNSGSLSERILYRYGNTAEGMVQATLEYIEIFRDAGFHNLVISLKAANVQLMREANLLMVDAMLKKGYYYPLHLGVTEAGAGISARVKSAAGIGSLLARGIGDTVRVSLTENPVEEIPFAKKLVSFCSENHAVTSPQTFSPLSPGFLPSYPVVISTRKNSGADFQYAPPTLFSLNRPEKRTKIVPVEKDFNGPVIAKFDYDTAGKDEMIIKTATDVTLAADRLQLSGLWIENRNFSGKFCTELSLEILQALRLRFSKTEFIACPSCGRTKFNIAKQLDKIRKLLPDFPNLKIAVMGCIVNGIGEMGDADYGYVGTGAGRVTLYKGRKPVMKNIPENEAAEKLMELIMQYREKETD